SKYFIQKKDTAKSKNPLSLTTAQCVEENWRSEVMKPSKVVIGENIKRYREEAFLKQEELAKEIGIKSGQSYIAGVESGSRRISLDTLDKIADALGITFMDLVEDWSDYEINDAIKEADENERWG